MPIWGAWTISLEAAFLLFAVAAAAVAVSGFLVARLADRLADQTRLGETVVGGVLLGMSTSLSGTVTSVAAAADGLPSLAVSNAVGGIAVQTVFLVVADLVYRKVNLEHAAADANNMFQAAMLLLLLGLALAAYLTPPVDVWSIHPVTVVLFAVYAFGTRSAIELRRRPMWQPRQTAETRHDEPQEPALSRWLLLPHLLRFLGLASILSAAGYVIAKTGAHISGALGISQTAVGMLLTATATSLPELVTTLAAVRQGALQLAVGGIIGGNTFDVLFLSLSDIAYRDGSIYHAMSERDALLMVAAIVMTAVLLMGLIMRSRRGIGFEGIAILVLYAATALIQVTLG